jgi:hypothetical protein
LVSLSALAVATARFTDMAASQNVAERFVVLPTSQNIALRAPDLSAHLIDFQVVATLPPIGHSRFCLHYPEDCKVRAIDFRRRNIALTPGLGRAQ